MTRRSAVPLALLILSATALAGCFGDVKAVYVPDSHVPDGWAHVQENGTKELTGGVEIVANEYRYTRSTYASVYAIGATDVPFVDEGDRLRKTVREQAENAGVALTKTGSTTMELDSGKQAKVEQYDISRTESWGQANGEAWLLTWDAGDFFGGAIGYATTEYQSSQGELLGGGTVQDDAQWGEVQDMLMALEW